MYHQLLGSVLVLAAIGGLVTLPVAAYVQDKMGSAKCLFFGNILLAGLMPILGISGVGLVMLYPVFFCVGIGLAFSDMAMTAQGVAVEKKLHRNKMGFFQAMLSIGNFAGVMIGGALAYLGLMPLGNFSIVASVSIPMSCWFFRFLTSHDEELLLHGIAPLERVEDVDGYTATDGVCFELGHSGVGIIDGVEDEESSGDSDETTEISNKVKSDSECEGEILSLSEDTAATTTQKPPQMPRATRNMLLYLSASGLCAQLGEGTIADW